MCLLWCVLVSDMMKLGMICSLRIGGPKLLGSRIGFHICCTPTSGKRTKCGNLCLIYVTKLVLL